MSERGNRKVRQGIVVSNAMDKTIVVKVVRRLRHPMYGKFINKSKNFKAHDENNSCNVGDEVRIMESRPYSKDKRWRLLETVKQAAEA
ncbi:MAG: 30S ribosomal protein S17 [Candidatus Marinimicrobia bacterium]|nr:30S ribosomal protein S17 [Candidatus Neomarinimicrobiota bacterium]MCF7851497.1 30S ribosomal protein S17 [Candidatus Neomarinimicrobiota bacterium]